MGLDTAEEKRRASNRYVQSNYGLWSGRDVLPWYYRVALSPIYAAMIVKMCLKGVPVNLQILHESDYEPDEEKMVKCPQCHLPKNRDVELDFKIE